MIERPRAETEQEKAHTAHIASDRHSRERKLKRRKRRIIVYGSLAAAFGLFYWWIPWEFDFIKRKLPPPSTVNPDSEKLFAKGTRIAVVTAHPDDSEFYIGSLLVLLAQGGADLVQIVVTDGDKGYYPFENYAENRRIRREEQREASSHWKAREIIFLEFPDGRLRASTEVVDRIRQELRRIEPEYVLSFDDRYPPRFSHQDHRRSGEAVREALKGVPSVKWLLCYSTMAPNYVVDVSELWDKHRELLAIHKSQFHGERLKRVEGMVGSTLSDAGDRIGVGFGVGLRCERIP